MRLSFFGSEKAKGQILLRLGVDKEDGVAPFPNLFRVKICKIGKSVRRHHHHPCLQLWVNGFFTQTTVFSEFVEISLASLQKADHLIITYNTYIDPAKSYAGFFLAKRKIYGYVDS